MVLCTACIRQSLTSHLTSVLLVQVALFDRIHNIRVKHIQEEYQKYMERVRSKAQGAIDQANGNYQHHRAMLTARVDTLVQYLQQQYLRVSSPAQPSSELPALHTAMLFIVLCRNSTNLMSVHSCGFA